LQSSEEANKRVLDLVSERDAEIGKLRAHVAQLEARCAQAQQHIGELEQKYGESAFEARLVSTHSIAEATVSKLNAAKDAIVELEAARKGEQQHVFNALERAQIAEHNVGATRTELARVSAQLDAAARELADRSAQLQAALQAASTAQRAWAEIDAAHKSEQARLKDLEIVGPCATLVFTCVHGDVRTAGVCNEDRLAHAD
jgi:chromosome segregation ATPase